MAATNSTQTPMNVVQRSTSSHVRLVEKPAANADKRVEQDAPRQHAAAAEAIGEVAAEQAEDAAADRRHVEQQPDPVVDTRGCRARARRVRSAPADDQRQHQQLVGVEREADRGNDADEPLDGREPVRCVHSGARSAHGRSPSAGIFGVVEFTADGSVRFSAATRVVFGAGRVERARDSSRASSAFSARCSSPIPGWSRPATSAAVTRRSRAPASTSMPYHDFGENPDSAMVEAGRRFAEPLGSTRSSRSAAAARSTVPRGSTSC